VLLVFALLVFHGTTFAPQFYFALVRPYTYNKESTARTGKPGQDRQNRPGRKGQAEQKTDRTGKAEQDR
jgi:hypothetical protein